MKLFLYYNKFFLLLILLNFFTLSIVKADNIERDFKELTSKLRCMTCQNQTIYDSDADFSKDIKKIIRKKLNEGGTKNEIAEFLSERYGEYILFEPRFDRKNSFLWIFPFIILIVSAIFLIRRINKNY